MVPVHPRDYPTTKRSPPCLLSQCPIRWRAMTLLQFQLRGSQISPHMSGCLFPHITSYNKVENQKCWVSERRLFEVYWKQMSKEVKQFQNINIQRSSEDPWPPVGPRACVKDLDGKGIVYFLDIKHSIFATPMKSCQTLSHWLLVVFG